MNMPRLRTVLASAVLAVTVTGMAALAAPAASAATTEAAPAAAVAPGTLTSTVTGTFTDAAGGVGTFTGAFAPSQFAANSNQINATGLLTGQLVDSTGAAQSVSQSQTFAVTQILPGA